jgi:DNA-binding transcriptional LysR family regulator
MSTKRTRDRSLEAALDLELVVMRQKGYLASPEGRNRANEITSILDTLRSGTTSSEEIARAEAEGRRIKRNPFP